MWTFCHQFRFPSVHVELFTSTVLKRITCDKSESRQNSGKNLHQVKSTKSE